MTPAELVGRGVEVSEGILTATWTCDDVVQKDGRWLAHYATAQGWERVFVIDPSLTLEAVEAAILADRQADFLGRNARDRAAAYFLGKSADVSIPGLTRIWTCDRVDWTGFRCVVVLNNGEGGYRDLTLPPDGWDPASFGGWWAAQVTSLQAQSTDEAEMLALQALDGVEV